MARNHQATESIEQRKPRGVAPRKRSSASSLAGSDVLLAVGTDAKVRQAMHDVLHTPDDERMNVRLGPEQTARVAFRADHAIADAGAEFAEDFGRDFLMAAVSGEDIGEMAADAPEPSEVGEPFTVGGGDLDDDDELEDLTEDAEPMDDAVPSSRASSSIRYRA